MSAVAARPPATATSARLPPPAPVERRHWALLAGMVVTAWAVFAVALVRQHHAYYSNAFDLGFFDQIIWNTSQGRWFETSFVPYNFLGQHMEPVLLLFAAAYRLGAGVEMLLVVQAAAVAGAAAPLFLAARVLLRSAAAGLAVAGAFLLSPHVHGAVLFDFHPEVIGVAAVVTAFALLVHGRPGWALVAVATLLLLKEEAALAAAGFALVVYLAGYRRHALLLLGGSFLYVAVVAGIVMPAIRGGPGDLQDRYGYLGSDAPAVATAAVRHPERVVTRLGSRASGEAVLYLVGSLALLPLVSAASLAALPLVAAHLLSTHPPQHGLTLHYAALPYALLAVAALLGAARLVRAGGPGRARAVAAVLLGAACVAWFFGSPLGPRRFEPDRYRTTGRHAAVERILARVPPEAAVSAQSGLLPHLSRRREVWEFPRLERADYVVVDARSWRSSQSADAGFDAVLDSLPALGFCRLHAEDGVALYTRGERCASP